MSNNRLLVYVHGAGDQGRRSSLDLKREYDQALFDGPGPSSVPVWWRVFWDRANGPALESALNATIQRLADHPSTTPGADATELLAAIRTARPPIRPTDADEEAAQEMPGGGGALDAIQGCYRSASTLAGPTEMPEPIFRFLAGQASKDVVSYLYDGWAVRMRAPVKRRLRSLGKERPLVVLGHSLGSILAYDVVTDPEFASWNLQLFVTAGSPLGIENVVVKVRDRKGPGPFPPNTTGWQNFHDSRDKVGWFGETLAGKYLPKPPLTQKLNVVNDAPDHHALVGYLVDPDLRRVVRAAVGL